jgi:hypothetical protein
VIGQKNKQRSVFLIEAGERFPNDCSEKRWNIIVGLEEGKEGEREREKRVALWPSWLACFEMLSAPFTTRLLHVSL